MPDRNNPYPVGTSAKPIKSGLLGALLTFFDGREPATSYHLDRQAPFSNYGRRVVRGHLSALVAVGHIEQFGRTRGGTYRTSKAGKRHLKHLLRLNNGES